jgi:hypothetical protein
MHALCGEFSEHLILSNKWLHFGRVALATYGALPDNFQGRAASTGRTRI